MNKLLRGIQSLKTEQWLGVYGLYLCAILIIFSMESSDYFELSSEAVPFYSLIPLIVLGSIQLLRKLNVISIMYSIPVVILINLLLKTL